MGAANLEGLLEDSLVGGGVGGAHGGVGPAPLLWHRKGFRP